MSGDVRFVFGEVGLAISAWVYKMLCRLLICFAFWRIIALVGKYMINRIRSRFLYIVFSCYKHSIIHSADDSSTFAI